MNKTDILVKYLKYKTQAFTDHDLHSPFVFDLYTELIRNKLSHYDFEALNTLRKQLLSNATTLEVTDFGAGSKIFKNNTRQIKEIAKHGISQKKYAEFLFRLANKFSPKTIVELGTSIGLTTLYFAKACPASTVYTIEGSHTIFEFSSDLFKQQQQKNIQAIEGNFDSEFPKLLETLDSIDLLYIDGNHAYEPTMKYFNLALQKKQAGSVFIFDDIHWSEEMERAWEGIKQHPDVNLSLDLFYLGIVFFRKEQKQKEHFILRY